MSHRFVNLTGGQQHYYEERTTTTSYVERPFGTMLNSITISNDSVAGDNVQVSFDGTVICAELKQQETLTINTHNRSSIWIKATVGGEKVRIWSW